MAKLVVGCGYLGLPVALAWRAAGEEVYVLTRSTAHAEQFRSLNLQPIVGDVMSVETLSPLPQVETMLMAVGYDRAQNYSQRDVFVTGLQNVLQVMSGHCQRIISISSTSVYGQNRGEWVDEESECQPTREGGMLCLQAEELLKKHTQQERLLQTAILRCAGIYGPHRLLRRIEHLKSQQPIAGNPDAWLNLIHVDDAVQAVLAADNFLAREPGSKFNRWLAADNRPIQRRFYYNLLARCLEMQEPQFENEPEENHLGINKRCRNEQMKQDLEISLHFASIEQGLPQAVRLTN